MGSTHGARNAATEATCKKSMNGSKLIQIALPGAGISATFDTKFYFHLFMKAK